MKDIVIFGAGGLAKETVLMITDGINYYHKNAYRILGFVVEEKYYQPGKSVSGYPILGTERWVIDHKGEVCCALAIGEHTHERERIFNMLKTAGVKLETLICGNAYVPKSCKIGEGCYIGTGVSLSADVEIGDGTFINSQVMIGHDVKIGRFCSFYPRATISGGCVFGDHVNVGGSSYIVPRKKIGTGAYIAAGSVVFANVKADTHVLGNPAKRITL